MAVRRKGLLYPILHFSGGNVLPLVSLGTGVSDVQELSAAWIHVMLGQKSSSNCFCAQH